MSTPRYPLELSAEDVRLLADQAVELVVRATEDLPLAPASGLRLSADLLAELSRTPPEGPGNVTALLDLTRRAAASATETAGPSYLGFIPGGGLLAAAVAEFLAAGLNRHTGKAALAPGFVAMEQSVLQWMCDLFGMPHGAQGLLTTGGSMANLIAVVAARTRHAHERTDRATVYVGEHGHGSLVKAARTAGISRAHIRVVRSTPELRMEPDHLRELIREDRAAGLIPICACASAGTTNTGTVDPLAQIADVAQEAGIWLHVDAAYGGFFRLTDTGHRRLGAIERADSITLDPHKSLFLPYGTGALIVRSAEALRRAFAEEADYMQDLTETRGLPDFDHLGPELTREFRGLRVWLPLHLHGLDAFRRELDEKLELAELAFQTLAADERFEVPWKPDLTVVPFRLAGAPDAVQLRLLERINASERVLLSSTRIENRFYLRIAVLSFRTHTDRIHELLNIIRDAAASADVAG